MLDVVLACDSFTRGEVWRGEACASAPHARVGGLQLLVLFSSVDVEEGKDFEDRKNVNKLDPKQPDADTRTNTRTYSNILSIHYSCC